MKDTLAPGSVTVITGAARGIGAAIATNLAARGLKLALFDRDAEAPEALAGRLDTEVLTVTGDVSLAEDCERLHRAVTDRYGAPHLLINNAGMMHRPGPWASPEEWREVLDVNFTSALRMQHLFVPDMIAGDQPGVIVNLGSKEGITTPPGQAAYSVAKAGIKVLTEQLDHALRTATDGRLSAHLLGPGYTYTPMNFPDTQPGDGKPDAPWSAEQMVDYFMARLQNGDFYILCPDNEVTPAMDAKRIRWAAEDMVLNRPALSRWHPEYKEDFSQWMKS
ncbi:SDR family oxidoreductase [Pseudooceanicola sediminis]|uniref:SDR family oxidoreductase n=2 Tax=Pseudooceanicola sediminis TaxID=2211117 RepID=A0A399IZN3_9RHOB|nr:SDR family oxidoreductase [Puniceibacterium sp. HSS470]RII37052.1 SDR family oxidoreductase [Pseudooceanicola sediminis]|tara:strand:- start:33658 stop:34491 length:834 start_codon:yes stop_codon:yes gene_type:complete